MKSSMCENCIKYKTIYCPNSGECLAREDKPFYEDKYTILTRNEALEEVLKDCTKENQQLKIQISAREEDYRKLEKIVKDVGMWNTLYNEEFNKNKKLENNWNKLKEYIEEHNLYYKKAGLEMMSNILNGLDIINKMRELEDGVSDVGD